LFLDFKSANVKAMSDLTSASVNHVPSDVEKGVGGTAKHYAGPELERDGTKLKSYHTVALKIRYAFLTANESLRSLIGIIRDLG
jgi:hypothetical protein